MTEFYGSGNTLGDSWEEWLSTFRARDAGQKRARHVPAIETYRRVDLPHYRLSIVTLLVSYSSI